jgi:hypothetical protein
MISGISAIQASSNIATPPVEGRPIAKAPPAPAAENVEDTVQLSDTAQQHLAASQAKPAGVPETVAQVIKSATEGNIGALSRLMVI